MVGAHDLGEQALRLLAFACLLVLLGAWERSAWVARQQIARRVRWPTNLGLGALDVVVVRLIFPAGAVGAAVVAAHHGIGALNVVHLPPVVTIAASIVLLDFAVYLQHRLFHVNALLWRIHRVHHADPELDVSTALRFHPIESLISMLWKAAIALAFGLPAAGVLAFEVILNGAAMFNHANGLLPPALERAFRYFVVTPDMHRVHHSTAKDEANSNFGFSLSWWDRLLGTYRAAPRLPQAVMSFGLPDGTADRSHVRLGALLAMPFRSRA